MYETHKWLPSCPIRFLRFPKVRYFNKTFNGKESQALPSSPASSLPYFGSYLYPPISCFYPLLASLRGLSGVQSTPQSPLLPGYIQTISLPHKMRSAPPCLHRGPVAASLPQWEKTSTRLAELDHGQEVQLLQLSWSNKWQIKWLATNTAWRRLHQNTNVSCVFQRVKRRKKKKKAWTFWEKQNREVLFCSRMCSLLLDLDSE